MASQQQEVNKLVATIQVLKNRDLIFICQSNGLAKSGNKADLHKRIINYIDASVHDPNQRNYNNIRNSIMQVTNGTLPANYRGSYLGNSPIPSSPSYNQAGMSSPYNGTGGTQNGLGHNGARAVFSHQGLQFKPSPFYEIEAPIGDVRQCEAMAQHRNSITIVVRASQHPDLQRCLTDPAIRVMIFCAANNYGIQDVAFPYQCEIKVNGGEVKANLRGLKNKPGSTRPVDITDQLRQKPPTYGNSLEFTYALTSKRFYLALYICKTYSAPTLASRIEKRSRITRASVIREVTKQAQDPDIVATSLVLSLKCPLTYMRLSLPVRATTCKHIQCFDATSYLQLQEQGPQWLCPVCSNAAPYDALAVDEYVKDILENTPSDLDQVTIDPDGTWHTAKDKDQDRAGGVSTPPRSNAAVTSVATLLDDEFEILSTPVPRRSNGYSNGDGGSQPNSNGGSTVVGHGNGNGHDMSSSNPTLINSRDTTATPNRSTVTPNGGGGLNSNNKRPREVIDLTLDSDEDDEPLPRRFKRQNTGTDSTGYGGSGSSAALYDGVMGNAQF
ncbi:protein inhibitor of activated STAT [Sporothrix schenckii 1099-18]|uniref:Protein inhibitor of activated STAT n=1 Tax=Sporothrix schenckii 1099-18 TaxID=1397361 RepID=A0A0F2MBY6_SPOSC|nr:protein inhibitor of activated STAT [Sporothrix schenckii 1099-18]KJR86350.1 protein inhibitor of activated STAT [Sporothrix schenckii 1099-18]